MYSWRGYSQGYVLASRVYLYALYEFENLHNFVHNLKIKLYTYFIFTEVKYYINIIVFASVDPKITTILLLHTHTHTHTHIHKYIPWILKAVKRQQGVEHVINIQTYKNITV